MSGQSDGGKVVLKVTREGPTRITKATVDAAWRRRAPGSRLVVGDQACRGLALVVNSGSMAWTYSYKPRGLDAATGRRFPSRSVTIGNPETHSPEAARAEANRLKGEAAAGGDPAADRRAQHAAAAAKRAASLSRLLDSYAANLPKKPKMRGGGVISDRHAREEEANARAGVAAMRAGEKAASAVTADDLRTMIKASVGTSARNRFGALSRFFDWCQDEGHLTVNPCLLVAKSRRPPAPAAREHFLSPPDLAALWKAAGSTEELDTAERDLAQFLMVVPCRRGEGAGVRWEHLNLSSTSWSQPGKLTKNREPHRIHLPPLATAILRRRWEAFGKPTKGLVFPAPRSSKALATFTAIKAALTKATGLTGWTWHDFRRSFASALGDAGVAEPVVDAVLNHRQAATRGGVLGVYQRSKRWPEQVTAMQRWGDLLAAAIEGREPEGNVVVLRRGEEKSE